MIDAGMKLKTFPSSVKLNKNLHIANEAAGFTLNAGQTFTSTTSTQLPTCGFIALHIQVLGSLFRQISVIEQYMSILLSIRLATSQRKVLSKMCSGGVRGEGSVIDNCMLQSINCCLPLTTGWPTKPCCTW